MRVRPVGFWSQFRCTFVLHATDSHLVGFNFHWFIFSINCRPSHLFTTFLFPRIFAGILSQWTVCVPESFFFCLFRTGFFTSVMHNVIRIFRCLRIDHTSFYSRIKLAEDFLCKPQTVVPERCPLYLSQSRIGAFLPHCRRTVPAKAQQLEESFEWAERVRFYCFSAHCTTSEYLCISRTFRVGLIPDVPPRVPTTFCKESSVVSRWEDISTRIGSVGYMERMHLSINSVGGKMYAVSLFIKPNHVGAWRSPTGSCREMRPSKTTAFMIVNFRDEVLKGFTWT